MRVQQWIDFNRPDNIPPLCWGWAVIGAGACCVAGAGGGGTLAGAGAAGGGTLDGLEEVDDDLD